jgi:hypothetical protein
MEQLSSTPRFDPVFIKLYIDILAGVRAAASLLGTHLLFTGSPYIVGYNSKPLMSSSRHLDCEPEFSFGDRGQAAGGMAIYVGPSARLFELRRAPIQLVLRGTAEGPVFRFLSMPRNLGSCDAREMANVGPLDIRGMMEWREGRHKIRFCLGKSTLCQQLMHMTGLKSLELANIH